MDAGHVCPIFKKFILWYRRYKVNATGKDSIRKETTCARGNCTWISNRGLRRTTDVQNLSQLKKEEKMQENLSFMKC